MRVPDEGKLPVQMPKPPHEIARLVDAIGVDATLRFVEARGGTRVFIPQMVRPDKGIGKEIELDDEACRKLSESFSRDYIRVPLVRSWRARVYRTRKMSYSQIAKKLGMSDVGVFQILRDAKMTVQMELPFDP